MSQNVERYCRSRTRARLAYLAVALLLLLFGGCLAAVFVLELGEDKAGWGISDYGKFALAGFLGVAALAGAAYEGWTAIRDALFPAKSRLAKSIRSQLPYPEEAPEVAELFARVDRDIQENGVWFDRVAVGREWVLGDDASLLSRVRVVFGRNETKVRQSGGRTQTARIVELYILDDRRQVQVSGLRKPKELQPLLDCLKLRAPDALFCPYSRYLDYCGKSEEEWEALLRDYDLRKARREAAGAAAPRAEIERADLDSPRRAAFQVSELGLRFDGEPPK